LPHNDRHGYKKRVETGQPVRSGSSAQPVRAEHPTVLWVGPTGGPELSLARQWTGEIADVVEAVTPDAAVAAPPPVFADRSPAVVLLACPAPGSWTLADAVRLSRQWPLSPVVSVATTLVDGRRRSGPPLPAVDEVAWYELPGRLAWWLADLAAGAAGTLGMPATARREERVAEAAARVATATASERRVASVAAFRPADLESLAELVAAAGCTAARRTIGRPPVNDEAGLVFWDVANLANDHLTWLAMLTAQRPGLRVVVLDSFPRGDSAQAALAAGAAAVLGRPASLEAVAGTVLRLEKAAFRR
jgi:hypothetical protein